jgi:enoyl-CoA hydratase
VEAPGDYARYRGVRVSIESSVLTLTLDSPENGNAISGDLHSALSRIWDDIQDDPSVQVVVLTGAGKTFSAGGDLAAMQQFIDEPDLWNRTAVPEARRIVLRMLECDKPVIAKVNGHAAGLGATLAVLCDIVVMAEHARIGDPHVRAGLPAGDGGALIWPHLVGFARAKEFLLRGTMLTAAQAVTLGLANHSVAAGELDATVDAIARELASGATRSIRATKRLINLQLRQIAPAVMDLGLSLETQENFSADHQEAVRAFADRRAPVFTGQ